MLPEEPQFTPTALDGPYGSFGLYRSTITVLPLGPPGTGVGALAPCIIDVVKYTFIAAVCPFKLPAIPGFIVMDPAYVGPFVDPL